MNRRNQRRLIRRELERMERDGLVRWNGEWRNGQKVYVTTDRGLEWARAVLDGETEPE